MVQSQSQQWLIRAWRLIGMQFLLLTARTCGQLEQYYQAGTVVGGMATPTGRPYYACPPGFLRMANSCYRLSTSAATWRDAHFQCRDLGAQLAAFERPWEDRTVRKFLNNANLPSHERWIGASYDSQSHRWIWSAKAKPTTYKSFPRRFVTADWSWHCLVLDPVTRYHWRPRLCMQRNYFLCEMPLHCVVGPNEGVPTNGTAPVLISGNRCGGRAREDTRHRQRRPGSGRRHGQPSERPSRLDELQRQRPGQNEPEDRGGRGSRRRDRDRDRHAKKKGRQRNRVPQNVEYQSYQHYGFHPLPQTVYTDETTYPRRTYERADKNGHQNSKTTQHFSNEIPIYPLAELPLAGA